MRVTVLSDRDIKRLLAQRVFQVEPLGHGAIGPASVDLRLGETLIRYRAQTIDLGISVPHTEESTIPPEGHVLEPGEFILGTTLEAIRIPNDHEGFIDTKGDMARAGLQVHSNDAHIDAGTCGRITLEIKNLHGGDVRLVLHAGMYICQLFLVRLSSATTRPYAGKYANQVKPTAYIP